MNMRMHLAVLGGLLPLAAPLCADVTAELSPLSPACQIQTDGDAIRVFAEMEAWGEEPPRWLGTVVDGRVRALPRDSAAVVPEEPWAVVWFGSAPFLPHFDVPWLVVFPDRVHALSLDGHGLRVDFRGAGRVRMMPLMGAAKLLRDPGAPHPWAEGLPTEVADQARELTRVLLARPVAMTETATADPGTDALTLHYRVTAWDDECDYDTEPRRVIPLPSVLLHALQAGFPGAVHGGQLRDLAVFTPYGPWGGVEADDECELVFPLLEYVHQAERPVPVDRLADGPAAEALARLRDVYDRKFVDGEADEIWDHGGPDNFCWQVMGDRFYAMGLPYAGQEAVEAASALRAYMRGHVLDETNYVGRRGVLLLEGPGIGSWGRLGDAGKFSTNVLETLWWYAHNTGDWSLIEDRWPTIERLFVMPMEVRFHTFGRGEIAEMGDEAAPPLCYARMAWRVGDREEYARGCSLFVREMAHLWLKFRGAELFREHWPVSSMEPYGAEIYLTNLWGDTAGWQIDGPEYPEETGERQYNNRWVRFSHPDVARALRELLGNEVEEEIDLLTRRDDFYGLRRPVAHITPSIERLRSLLLDETDEELAELSPPDTWPGGRYADQIAYYLAFIWGAREGAETERVVPRDGQAARWGTRVPWWPDEDPALVVQLTADPDLPHGDPTLSWHGWSPPQQAEGYPRSGSLSFGQIRPDGE